ncbi:hypothetical protein [Pseudomonas putida]|uniref:hypothetical protein n=1 Tax=Pseudomonas putida TaxID=303 RepID=UPI003B01DE6B
MADDRPDAGGGGVVAEHPAHPHCVHSAAGAAVVVCTDPPAHRPPADRLRDHLRPDYPVHVLASGLRQHIPQ